MCNKSESITNLAVALVKFNGEISKISKDAANPFFKNNYATLDNIVDEVRPILQKHGLSILQIPGGDGENVVMKTMLLHESGEWIESDSLIMKPVKNDPQSVGSCITYARRYSIASFLSLNTGEDDDGNKATHAETPVQTRQQSHQSNPSIQQSKHATSQPSTSQPAASKPLISDAQVGYCKKLQREKHISDDDFHRMVAEYNEGNDDIKQLSKKQASEFINFLNAYAAA